MVKLGSSIGCLVIPPGDHELAVTEIRDLGLELITGRPVDINRELVTLRRTVGIIALAIEVVVITVAVLLIRLPGYHITAVTQRCHRRQVLRAVGGGINPELLTNRIAQC